MKNIMSQQIPSVSSLSLSFNENYYVKKSVRALKSEFHVAGCVNEVSR